MMSFSRFACGCGVDAVAYTVLARRFRSRTFDEVVGQEPIARTLRNAIDNKRVAHAYLFCGTRGVGKTSMARILATALNVTPELAEADAIRDAIFRGDDLDVIEIDGASNRGINEARDLIAAAELSPSRCPKKIYIIDEVHMLTREAFNALLKTMEEPPSHVIFILCTTEAHKVPATIQSRCQRFDFRALTAKEIGGQIEHILKQEKIKADDEVVLQVARLANGSMRDGLSLLDRLLAAGEKKLTAKLLEEMLGLPEQKYITDLVEAIIRQKPDAALTAADTLLQRGSSLDQTIELLTDYFHMLMLISACGADSEMVPLSDDAREQAVQHAGHFDTPALVHIVAMCDAIARKLSSAPSGRALFDALVVRLCLVEQLADVSQLLAGGSPAAPRSSAAPEKKKSSMSRAPAQR